MPIITTRCGVRYRVITRGGRRIFEHRAVIEDLIGRALLRSEIVHHVDGDGLNNAPANLVVMNRRGHNALHRPARWNIDEATRLRGEGWSIYRLSRRFGVTQPAIREAFIARGIDTSAPPIRLLRWSLDDALRLRSLGRSWSNISLQLGVERAAIRSALRHRGIVVA